jgi:NADH:ubiquinone oxidoreductase subunit E
MQANSRTTVTLCLGSSCFTRGNNDHLPLLQQALGEGGLAGRVHLKGSHCEGRCLNGPILRLGDEILERLNPGRIPEVLLLVRERVEAAEDLPAAGGRP